MPLTRNEFDNISLTKCHFWRDLISFSRSTATTHSTPGRRHGFFFFFPACTSHHVGSYFPDQGLNQNLPQWRCKVLNWTAREAPEEGMALAESNCQQKGKVARARKDFEIHTLRNSLCCILTDVICLNTFYQQELTTSEAAHFLYRLWHSLENSLMRPQSIIHGFIVLGCPLGIT